MIKVATQSDAPTLHTQSNVASFLLSSSVPCCTIDTTGKILVVGSAFRDLLPNYTGGNLTKLLNLKRSAGGPLTVGERLQGYSKRGPERIPVSVSLIAEAMDGAELIALLNDGQPFRNAETARFDVVPYGVFRLTDRGTITYNNHTGAEFVSAPDDLLGKTFSELFQLESGESVGNAIEAALSQRKSSSLRITVAASPNDPVLVAISPDMGPDDTILGVVAVMESLRMERGREEIQSAVLSDEPWRDRIRRVLDVVKRYVPFDLATFGIYSDSHLHFRPILIVPPNPSLWPSRWVPISSATSDWLNTTDTWSPDIDRYAEAFPELKNDPVFRRHLATGIRSFVVLPIRGPHRLSCSLSLASNEAETYSADSRVILEELRLPQFLLQFESAYNDEVEVTRRVVQREIRAAANLDDATTRLVGQIQSSLQWDYVGIYLVDERREQFKLVAQAACSEQLKEHERRVQPINLGMLGATFEANKGRGVEQRVRLKIDETECGEPAYGYFRGKTAFRSAITYPIALHNSWYWILDIEDTEPNAFHGPDLETLDRIVPVAERELDRLYRAQLNSLLVNKSPDGIVITDSDGDIIERNKVATERLLGVAKEPSKKLEDYAADVTSVEVLSGRLPDTCRRISLKGPDGKVHPVLANRYDLADNFPISVWFFVDLENLNWNVEYRYLQEVVNDVAQQTRGSLMLASHFLQTVAAGASNVESGVVTTQIVERALEEIGKVDITFERLAEALSATKEPRREEQSFDLTEAIKKIVAALPSRDRANITLSLSDKVVMKGDVGRVRFAIRSALGHLLRARPVFDDKPTRVVVEVFHKGHGIELMLRIDGLALTESTQEVNISRDPFEASQIAARDESSLGLATIERIVQAHGGSIRRFRLTAGSAWFWAGFTMNFPSKLEG